MKELIEIYTKSKTFNNNSEIMKELHRIRTEVIHYSFVEMARYVCHGLNGKSILVELQVSTRWCKENDIEDFIQIVAYEFEGQLSDYSADLEIKTIEFNEDWGTVIKQMKQLAIEVKEGVLENEI